MRRDLGMRRTLATAFLVSSFALLLAACGEPVSDEHVIDEPATLSEIENEAGEEVMQIGLTSSAAERLGIETVPLSARGKLMTAPLSAVFLDTEGGYWLYTNPKPLTYIREPIEVKTEQGQIVYISAGPPVGTDVVTVGVPELWGTETGMDH
jgi:hypothetical protein